MAPSAATGADIDSELFANVNNNTHQLWWKDPGLRRLNIVLLSTFLGPIANGYDISLISGLNAIPQWFEDLSGLEDASTSGLLIAVADRLGRRWGIIIGGISTIAPVIGQSFCKTAVYHAPIEDRTSAVAGVLFNTFFFVGSITDAWASFGSHYLNTRLRHIYSGVSALPINNNRPGEARKIPARFHANGNETDELVVIEFSEICASTEISRNTKVSWASLFATPGNRRRVSEDLPGLGLGLATQWVGNSNISYYFVPVLETVGISDPTKQQGVNGGLQVYSWILAICGAPLAERCGRRRLFLVSACTMLLFMILVLAWSAVFANTGNPASGAAVIVFLFLFLGWIRYRIYTDSNPLRQRNMAH
ncbi:sugar transporter, putative [Talaromyces stipitatus ATCC 10500]|uniref:Sugar transporter, putative n=1 Tax=Talaromyces stipitatus (strain ATCC 10500 / CBS 375.48 / QM 6759 / NRRL 1006) TaxID=441959 RepID=B8MGS9_TALSN|nr:sugar transporter, putative [Talaromyces stipitatus ATCC 10500]EED16310.1 sugar transporter, putative [Talaromyces stipitatus ATCC 10500]